MAFVLKKLNKLPVRVKGTLPGEDGKPVEFDFILHCKRLTQEEVEAEQNDKHGSVKGFLRGVAEGWEQVKDENGAAVTFSEDGLNGLLSTAGMPMLCFTSYMKQIAVAAKN
ncbi:hypothetical protein [Massilia alkalitolerans]|uniref:hypothetical protein n=1 Tax=Massilia alkalitolerans TaxID=286638 RepID=UPI0003FF75F8|nr:hypothetical protein [Massilia alkalitolerans]